MQNNRNSYRRKDRRDDAQTQESSTSYRPRTRRKNDAYMSRETREGRREQHRDRNQYSEASGSYRPRTIRKGYVEGADRRSTPSREREREQEYEYSIGTLGEEIQDITTRESGADRSRDTRRVRSHNSSELRRKRYEDNSSVDNRERRNTNSRKERSGARERNQEFFESSSRRTREEYVREAEALAEGAEGTPVFIENDLKQQVRIVPQDILCFLQDDNNPRLKVVHTLSSETIYLKQTWEEILRFCQSHQLHVFVAHTRKAIVNRSHIIRVNRPYIWLEGGMRIQVSREKWAELNP